VKDRVGRTLSRLFDVAATAGYLLFGVPMLIFGVSILIGSPLHPFAVLLGAAFALAGGGAVLASVQTWRQEPMALSGSLLMVAGMVALATIMVWVFTTSFGP
jgi:hypothetical protein